MAAGVIATTAGTLPAFLTGALGVQLQQELSFDAAGLGFAVALFFGAAAIGSGPAGALAQRIGPTRSVRIGTAATAIILLVIAFAVQRWSQLAVALTLAGLSNALIHPSVNALLIAGAGTRRRGLAFGIKQSGVPGATLLGGAAVPLLALTLGWRSAFLAAAGVALIAAFTVPATRVPDRGDAKAVTTLTAWLLMVAVATGLGSATASVLGVFVVPTAVTAGIAPGTAGWLLSAGSLTAIAVRIAVGWGADRARGRLGVVAVMLAAGAGGFALLGTDRHGLLVLGLFVAFGLGWGWNGLLNFSVADSNPERAAAVTGVTQAGVYTGATLGPAMFGVIVGGAGLGVAWLLAAAATLASAGLMVAGDRLRRRAVRRSAA